MQCKLCASYFQDAPFTQASSDIFNLIRHRQFSTKKSITQNPFEVNLTIVGVKIRHDYK
jgi:hypothetical protein